MQWLQLYRIGVAEFSAILASFRQELGPVQVWHPPGTGEILLVAGKTVPAGGNRRESVEKVWSRVAAGPFPVKPWLDDQAIGRWLQQAGGSDSKRLRARLEHRLPLLGEGGTDQSGQLLRSLQDSLENRP